MSFICTAQVFHFGLVVDFLHWHLVSFHPTNLGWCPLRPNYEAIVIQDILGRILVAVTSAEYVSRSSAGQLCVLNDGRLVDGFGATASPYMDAAASPTF